MMITEEYHSGVTYTENSWTKYLCHFSVVTIYLFTSSSLFRGYVYLSFIKYIYDSSSTSFEKWIYTRRVSLKKGFSSHTFRPHPIEVSPLWAGCRGDGPLVPVVAVTIQ